MIYRVEVASKDKLNPVYVYTIEANLNLKQLKKIANALTNPIIQISRVNQPIYPKKFSWAVEIGFLPGVTDNVANTTKEIIEDMLKTKFKNNEGVYSSKIFFYQDKLNMDQIKKIAQELFNPLIQRVHIKSYRQFIKEGGMDKIVPKVKIKTNLQIEKVNLNVPDEELIKIGKLGIKNPDGSRRGPLALNLTYMKKIQKYFQKLGRNPTDIELETIAQTWSEHCKHTIFANPIDEIKEGLFKTYIKGATEKILKKKKGKFCYSVFYDNSGSIEFNRKYLITHKIETHNSPSALDPFGGAITGILGVNRDAVGFGLGAKPITNIFGFCLAPPSLNRILYKDPKLKEKILSPRRIMDGVIAGVNSGGNCSGIPTSQGFLYFDKRYQGKPLVYVGTVGLIPKKINNHPSFIKKARPNDLIVMVGGRVGLDGIHGATFSSEALNTFSPATAVQIGDPITQKKLVDALIKEARDQNLYNSITDNGAGGLSCSVSEMAKEAGGCEVYLEKVPLKYPGLAPWQIWISESQERMTLAVPKNKWKKFFSLMKRRGVEATIIGKFTNSGKCVVKYFGKKIVDLDMNFLHYGLPPIHLKTKKPKIKETNIQKILGINKYHDLKITLIKTLADLNICSFEFISNQYDHEVQGISVIKPLQGKGRVNSEVTVIKPLFESRKGIALSQGLYPYFSEIDSYYMAGISIDTAIRNIIVVGAYPNKIALLDNFCWCSSNQPERLYQLKQAAKGCYDYALAYETPFISGKDSMFNDFIGYNKLGQLIKISVPPTLLISSIGIVDDIRKTVTIDIKYPKDLIYLLGGLTNDWQKINPEENRKNYLCYYQLIKENLISSAISVTRKGIVVALTKMAMAGKLGINVDLNGLEPFLEVPGRIIFTINPLNKKRLEMLLSGFSYLFLGEVIKEEKIIIKNKGKVVANFSINEALKSYKSTFKNY